MDMTNLHRSPPMNQSKTDLGIVNESQLLRFGISEKFTAYSHVTPNDLSRKYNSCVRSKWMNVNSHFSRLRQTVRDFYAARCANVAITFALILIPIPGMVGAAVDFSRAKAVKASMQVALDSTALMASKNAAALTSDQVQTSAQAYLFTGPGASALSTQEADTYI
jgi:hypothetical protein